MCNSDVMQIAYCGSDCPLWLDPVINRPSGPGAAIRGDFGKIIIKDGANVQENCTIHMFPGETVIINEGAHLGHGCIVHGATIGCNSLIGMNAVILDNAIKYNYNEYEQVKFYKK